MEMKGEVFLRSLGEYGFLQSTLESYTKRRVETKHPTNHPTFELVIEVRYGREGFISYSVTLLWRCGIITYI